MVVTESTAAIPIDTVGTSEENPLATDITPMAPPSGPPPTYTQEHFVTGIFSDTYGPLVKSFVPSSHWQGIHNGQRTFVYAGARAHDSISDPISDQGIVYLVVHSADFYTRTEAEFVAPGLTGLLTVVAEVGLRLTLIAESGDTLYFDIPSQTFVNNLSATTNAPTVTPLPLVTPTPDPFSVESYPAPATVLPATAGLPN